ncbi:MAG: indole-3-glycerol phosphate synthase TrpC [Desulfobacterales bacterium]|nr:indole-3-glycerol phosphate synthase TrpC [Desulfobacterales bacterium]
MHQRLNEILAQKRDEVTRLKRSMPHNRDNERPPLRDFKSAISIPQQVNLIAEIKFASPSAGLIREKADPVAIGRIYEEAGAAAISLLTDQRFFKGDIAQLPRLKKAISLPILRKDFIIDAIQIREAFLYGADALLLIARILSQQQLAEYIMLCRKLGMAPLTEVHSKEDLEKAVASGAEIIGINNRDLDNFIVDMNTTFELAPLIPNHCVGVCESGVSGEEDIVALKTTSIHAVLVGSSLMQSEDPGLKTQKIVRAGKNLHE